MELTEVTEPLVRLEPQEQTVRTEPQALLERLVLLELQAPQVRKVFPDQLAQLVVVVVWV